MFMSKYKDQTYAAFRIVFGLLFMLHGTSKIFNVPVWSAADQAPAFIKWFSGGIELVAGAMILVGFMAGWAAFLASGLMAGAYWMAHGLNSLFPHDNGGETAILYCFGFLVIAAHGSGIWSVDRAR